MITIGGRVGFVRIEELERNFKYVDFPIELALPWRYREFWLPIEDKIDQIIDFFKKTKFKILSIHATQGIITEESFIRWGKLTVDIALALKVNNITVHPNHIKKDRALYQLKVLKYLKEINRYVEKPNEDIIFTIETFSGKHRVFTPSELVEQKIPMTLDTAHIHDQHEVMKIIKQNHSNIKTIHLSAIGKYEHHLPVDKFCIKVVDLLKEQNWSGNIILEYLPWHHYRVKEDIMVLKEYIYYGKTPEFLPISNKFRNHPERYGYNINGT